MTTLYALRLKPPTCSTIDGSISASVSCHLFDDEVSLVRMAGQIYALQNLYEDQEPDLVADTIPAMLTWLGPSGDAVEPSSSFRVRLGKPGASPTEDVLLRLGWNAQTLERRCPGTLARVRRMRSHKTADREHLAELAAYSLPLVGISIWMPGRRVITFCEGLPPDILFDDTDGAVRGVEASGRKSGGFGALRVVLEGTKENRAGNEPSLPSARTLPRHTFLSGASRPRSRCCYR